MTTAGFWRLVQIGKGGVLKYDDTFIGKLKFWQSLQSDRNEFTRKIVSLVCWSSGLQTYPVRFCKVQWPKWLRDLIPIRFGMGNSAKLKILLSCWMIESRTTACAVADLVRCGCISACSDKNGAHVIRVPSLFIVTGMVLPGTKRKFAKSSRNVIPQSPFIGSLHVGHLMVCAHW